MPCKQAADGAPPVRDLWLSARVEGRRPSLLEFDGPNPSDRVHFFAHEANWSNRMTLGGWLLAIIRLTERKGLRGKFQIVYPNPPRGRRCGPAIPTVVKS